MAHQSNWPTKRLAVASLHLDAKNPRLGRESTSRAPREIIQYLFDYDKAMEVAESIAYRGYFPNEPLLAIKDGNKYVVVEGNRRLAALKALREPGLLSPRNERAVTRLAKRIPDLNEIASVPVIIAPNRRSTDRQIAGRHVGTPVLPWQAENRASFILDKLAEGYDNDQLRDELNFTLADIQSARQTRAIADMARSLDLPEEIRAKLDNPRAKIFSTIGRVFDNTVGREFLKVTPDPVHGLRGTTTKNEFVKGFRKLVHDIAVKGGESSRTLNKTEDMRKYFKSWKPDELPKDKRGSFVPADVIRGKSVASGRDEPVVKKTRSVPASKSVLPKSFKVRYGNDRLKDIRSELVKLNRELFPNAGAVLLRVFFELAVVDYLKRTGELAVIIKALGGRGKLQRGSPKLKDLTPAIKRIAKKHLTKSESNSVGRAISYDNDAPFSVSDLHAFVHQDSELPSERDIWQFWLRTEALFRLMLEQEPTKTK